MTERQTYETPEVGVFEITPHPIICASDPDPGGNESVGFENW